MIADPANKDRSDSSGQASALASILHSRRYSMRALLIGLVGVLAVVGGAAAGEQCSETQATLRAAPAQYQGPQKAERPDLVGRDFSVVRVLGANREWTKVLLLSDGDEQFVLGLIVTPRAVPGSFYASWTPSDPNRPRLTKKAPAEPIDGDQYADFIQRGPMAGLELNVTGCRPD